MASSKRLPTPLRLGITKGMTASFAYRFSEWLGAQRAVPYRIRRSLTKRICPDFLKSHAFDVDFFGLRYHGRVENYIDRLVFYCGAHEKYMLYFLRDYLKATGATGQAVYVDVGANVGNHALYMSQLAAQVHAYEPYAPVRAVLEEHIRVNTLTNVQVHPVGLSNRNDSIPFYAPPDANLGAGSFVEGCNPGNVLHGTLDVTVGDEALAKLNLPRLDVLKMDVEGFEPFALEGLKQSLAQFRPLMVVELSPKTRETFGSEAAFHQAFPPNYGFFVFKKADRDSGRYRLEPLEYHSLTGSLDVIACPEERLHLLPLKG